MISTLEARAADGTAVAARVAGEGAETILFVHGVGSTAAIWDYQLRALSGEYRCVAVELRGNRRTEHEPPPQSITRAGFAADVLAAADASRAARFHLVGCSLGGAVALELWKRAPERVATLVLVGSFAAYPNAQAYADAVTAQVRAAGSMEAFARMRAELLGLPPGRRRDETIEQMAVKSVASYVASTQATWTGDYRSVLAAIRVPTLVLAGEFDTVVPRALSREVADGIPGARFDIVRGAGHVANADRPEEFDALLRAFLREHAAAARNAR